MNITEKSNHLAYALLRVHLYITSRSEHKNIVKEYFLSRVCVAFPQKKQAEHEFTIQNLKTHKEVIFHEKVSSNIILRGLRTTITSNNK